MISNIDQITYIVRGRGEGKTVELLNKAFLANKAQHVSYFLGISHKHFEKFRTDYFSLYNEICPTQEFKPHTIDRADKPVVILVDEFAALELTKNQSIFNELSEALRTNKVQNIYITISGKVG